MLNYHDCNQPCTSLNQPTASQKRFDHQSKSELLAHVYLLLSSFDLTEAADVLCKEIEKKGYVPSRYNFLGSPCAQTFSEYVAKVKPFSNDLVDVVLHLERLSSNQIPPVISNLPIRLFSSKRQSLCRNKDVLHKAPRIGEIICRRPVVSSMEKISFIRLLSSRELSGQRPILPRFLLRKEWMKNLELHTRILGHLGPIYCVKFDATGRYLFTGADDNLIKVWDAKTCLLRYTFRGHTSFIMDMTICPENTMLASGSMDKTVRVWCLQRGKTLMVYKGHTASINTISFIPFLENDTRYLVSAGSDCAVVFLRYNAKTKEFGDNPLKFNERTKPGARIVSMCHSPGGNLVVMGDTHQNIRIFQVSEHNVERLYQIAAHTDRVDSLVWAHNTIRFLSGSKDGTARAWYVDSNGWNSTTFTVITEPRAPPSQPNLDALLPSTSSLSGVKPLGVSSKKNAYKVTMLCWSLNDDLVISSGSDNLLRTWNWKTGEMLKILRGHTDESFVLLAHPIYNELVLSVGHDAKLMIWNIYTGTCIKSHRNESDNHDIRGIFDMAISQDGATIAFVDSQGHLSILGLDSNQAAKSQPHEQFFSTDYRPLTMDDAGYVLDELTGLAPHNMGPPILVNSEGIPLADNFQRFVPGNDGLANQIDPICPWITRKIVPSLEPSTLQRMIEEWKVIHASELKELNESMDKENRVFLQIDPEHCQLVPRKLKNVKSSDAQSRRAQIEQMTNQLLYPPPGVPRYVIGDEDDSDEDDSTYNEEQLSDEANTVNTRSTRSTNNGNELDDEFVDEFDSDYEEGAPEQLTVYRKRTTLTVTGRPKKRRRMTTDEEGNTSQSSVTDERPSSSSQPRTSGIQRRKRNCTRRSGSVVAEDINNVPRRNGRKKGGSKRMLAASSDDGDTVTSQQSYSNVPFTSSMNGTNRRAGRRRGESMNNGRRSRGSRRRETLQALSSGSGGDGSSSPSDKSKTTPPSTDATDSEGAFSTHTSGSSKASKANGDDSLDNGLLMDSPGASITEYPLWMRATEVRRFPYIAQLGDVVVYFTQGHRVYVDEVVKAGLFNVTKKMRPGVDLDDMEVGIVDSIKYISSPYRLTVLNLAQLKNNRRTGVSFEITYHDFENVADFIFLKEHYDISISYAFKAGDAVEALIGDVFYTGIVQQRKPYEEDFPSSEWYSVVVRWDNADDEVYGPWDLQPKAKNRKSDIPASKAEMEKFGAYTPQRGDWPVPESCGEVSALEARRLYLNRAKLIITQLMEHPDSEPFREPVDLTQYRNYTNVVKYPIDLQTIEERIRRKFYRRHLAFIHDVQYLAINASKYNRRGAEIITNACVLVKTIFDCIRDFTISDASKLYDDIKSEGPLDLNGVLGGGLLRVKTDRSTMFIEINADLPGTSAAGADTTAPFSNYLNESNGSLNDAMSDQSSSVKWICECSEPIRLLLAADFVNSQEMKTFCQHRPTLKHITDQVAEFDGPEQFVDTIFEFLHDFRGAIADSSEGRRSRTYTQVLNIESIIRSMSKPIIAKFNRMNAAADSQDDGEPMDSRSVGKKAKAPLNSSGSSGGEPFSNGNNDDGGTRRRTKRAAALSAKRAWQADVSYAGDDDDATTSRLKMNLRNAGSQSRSYYYDS